MRALTATTSLAITALTAFFVTNPGQEAPPSPFDDVERIATANYEPAQTVVDVSPKLDELNERLEQYTRSVDQRMSQLVSQVEAVEEKATGPGFQLPDSPESTCDCDCLTEDEIRKLVSDEFDKQMLAEAVAPRGYGPTTLGSSSTTRTTFASPSPTVQYSTPATTTTMRPVTKRGLFGRTRTEWQPVQTTVQSSGTCQIIQTPDGPVRVCN